MGGRDDHYQQTKHVNKMDIAYVSSIIPPSAEFVCVYTYVIRTILPSFLGSRCSG